VISVRAAIVKIWNISGDPTLVTLKCPLIGLVESSIVLKNGSIRTKLSSLSSIYNAVADENVVLLNFK
jgi:hypothetical protein